MRAALLLLAALLASPAFAASVYVTSISRTEVSVIVDGAKTYRLRPGQATPEDVTLVEIQGQRALFDVSGKRWTLGLGQSTVSETQIRADARGQFFTTAYINGVPFEALIDTGATTVTLNSEAAARAGIAVAGAQRVISSTANGDITTVRVTLGQVQVGGIALRNVQGSVTLGGRAQLAQVLIGMSFLKDLQVQQSGNTLLLRKPDL